MEATPNLLAGNNCYPDSGANNLVPHDLNDLSIGFEQWSQQNSDRQWKRGPISIPNHTTQNSSSMHINTASSIQSSPAC
uniref:Uncharacterized protein n=1 Tax=Vitis vinifera TaxID=29760 RepID=F6HBT8_VITVI